MGGRGREEGKGLVGCGFEFADLAEGGDGGPIGVGGGKAGAGSVADGGGELGEGGVFQAGMAAAGAGEIGRDFGAGEITEGREVPDAGDKERARRAP